MGNIVISASFHPNKNKWSGFKVEMGVKGTHEDYNVLYNGVCVNEYFDSESDAKIAASGFKHILNAN